MKKEDMNKWTAPMTRRRKAISEDWKKPWTTDGNLRGERQAGKQEGEDSQHASGGKVFYSVVAHLQPPDDTFPLSELRNRGDNEGLLQAAKEHYDGNGINERYTFTSPLWNDGNELLAEDRDFAVTHNNIDGTYELTLKFTEREIRDHVAQYGVRLASNDIKEVARDMAEEQFSAMTRQQMPVLEMPNGEILHARYNRKTDTIDVGTVTNAGLAVSYSFEYDYDSSLDANLQSVLPELNQMGQHREEGTGTKDNTHQ